MTASLDPILWATEASWDPAQDMTKWATWQFDIWKRICNDAYNKSVFPREHFEAATDCKGLLRLIPDYRVILDCITHLKHWEFYERIDFAWICTDHTFIPMWKLCTYDSGDKKKKAESDNPPLDHLRQPSPLHGIELFGCVENPAQSREITPNNTYRPEVDFADGYNEWRLNIWTAISRDAWEKSMLPKKAYENHRIRADILQFRTIYDLLVGIQDREETANCIALWQHLGGVKWRLISVSADAYAKRDCNALFVTPTFNGRPPSLHNIEIIGNDPAETPPWNPIGDMREWQQWKYMIWVKVCLDAWDAEAFPSSDFLPPLIDKKSGRVLRVELSMPNSRYKEVIDYISRISDAESYMYSQLSYMWIYHRVRDEWELLCLYDKDKGKTYNGKYRVRIGNLCEVPVFDGEVPGLHGILIRARTPGKATAAFSAAKQECVMASMPLCSGTSLPCREDHRNAHV